MDKKMCALNIAFIRSLQKKLVVCILKVEKNLSLVSLYFESMACKVVYFRVILPIFKIWVHHLLLYQLH